MDAFVEEEEEDPPVIEGYLCVHKKKTVEEKYVVLAYGHLRYWASQEDIGHVTPRELDLSTVVDYELTQDSRLKLILKDNKGCDFSGPEEAPGSIQNWYDALSRTALHYIKAEDEAEDEDFMQGQESTRTGELVDVTEPFIDVTGEHADVASAHSAGYSDEESVGAGRGGDDHLVRQEQPVTQPVALTNGSWTAYQEMSYEDHASDVHSMECRNDQDLEAVKKYAEEQGATGISICRGFAMVKKPQAPLIASDLHPSDGESETFWLYSEFGSAEQAELDGGRKSELNGLRQQLSQGLTEEWSGDGLRADAHISPQDSWADEEAAGPEPEKLDEGPRPLFEGPVHLLKKSNRQQELRYFVLFEDHVEYFNNQQDFIGKCNPRGNIWLNGVESLVADENNVLSIKMKDYEKAFRLQTADQEDAKRWGLAWTDAMINAGEESFSITWPPCYNMPDPEVATKQRRLPEGKPGKLTTEELDRVRQLQPFYREELPLQGGVFEVERGTGHPVTRFVEIYKDKMLLYTRSPDAAQRNSPLPPEETIDLEQITELEFSDAGFSMDLHDGRQVQLTGPMGQGGALQEWVDLLTDIFKETGDGDAENFMLAPVTEELSWLRSKGEIVHGQGTLSPTRFEFLAGDEDGPPALSLELKDLSSVQFLEAETRFDVRSKKAGIKQFKTHDQLSQQNWMVSWGRVLSSTFVSRPDGTVVNAKVAAMHEGQCTVRWVDEELPPASFVVINATSVQCFAGRAARDSGARPVRAIEPSEISGIDAEDFSRVITIEMDDWSVQLEIQDDGSMDAWVNALQTCCCLGRFDLNRYTADPPDRWPESADKQVTKFIEQSRMSTFSHIDFQGQSPEPLCHGKLGIQDRGHFAVRYSVLYPGLLSAWDKAEDVWRMRPPKTTIPLTKATTLMEELGKGFVFRIQADRRADRRRGGDSSPTRLDRSQELHVQNGLSSPDKIFGRVVGIHVQNQQDMDKWSEAMKQATEAETVVGLRRPWTASPHVGSRSGLQKGFGCDFSQEFSSTYGSRAFSPSSSRAFSPGGSAWMSPGSMSQSRFSTTQGSRTSTKYTNNKNFVPSCAARPHREHCLCILCRENCRHRAIGSHMIPESHRPVSPQRDEMSEVVDRGVVINTNKRASYAQDLISRRPDSPEPGCVWDRSGSPTRATRSTDY